MDIVIRGGTIYDGRGAEPFEADVGIRDGVIVEIGKVRQAGAEEIDARGKIVTPGFVDIHTHFDAQAIWSATLAPSSSTGVTTAVMGSCGIGLAPCRAQDRELLVSVLEGVEDIPGAVMADGVSWEWDTYPEYLDALARRPHDIDLASLLPHMPLRLYAMGQRGADREPSTAEDLARMYDLTREAVAAGAIGVSTSQLFMHRTRDGDMVPTYGVAEDELHVIASALRDGGGGLWQASAITNEAGRRDLDDLAIFGRVVETAGGSGSFSLAQTNWRNMLGAVATLNAGGAAIRGQVFPRHFGLYVNFDLTIHPFCLCPSFRAIANLPMAEKLAMLGSPDFKAKLLAEEPVDIGQPFHAIGRKLEQMFILGDEPNFESGPEHSVAAIARGRGLDPLSFVYDVLLQDEGRQMLFLQYSVYADNSLDFIPELLRNPGSLIGLADAGAHYGMICDATYPTFLLTYWTRDRQGERLGLAEAIRMLTSDPAGVVQLGDRGVLAPGFKADLNVIDYDRLGLGRPEVVRDLPGGAKRIAQATTGYVATLVSGTIIRRDDQPTSALPGKLVRGRRAAPHRSNSRQQVQA